MDANGISIPLAHTNGSAMGIKLSQLEDLRKTLVSLPARQDPERELSSQEAIARLAKEIARLQELGYKNDDIANIFQNNGVHLMVHTLRRYLSRARSATGHSSATPATKRNGRPSRAPGEQTGVQLKASSRTKKAKLDEHPHGATLESDQDIQRHGAATSGETPSAQVAGQPLRTSDRVHMTPDAHADVPPTEHARTTAAAQPLPPATPNPGVPPAQSDGPSRARPKVGASTLSNSQEAIHDKPGLATKAALSEPAATGAATPDARTTPITRSSAFEPREDTRDI